MNKKFIIISMLIILIGVTFIGGTKIITDKNYNGMEKFLENSDNRNPEINFVKYEETDSEHRIILSVKNTWKKIITMERIGLCFANKNGGYVDLSISGSEYDYYKQTEEVKNGIEPGETVEYCFKIPKEVYFDKDNTDTNMMRVNWDVRDWNIRVSNSFLLGGFTSWGATTEIKNTGEPFSITGN